MSRFLTSVSNLVKEEYRTTMHQCDMNLSRFMVYAQSIEELMFGRRGRDSKRGRTDEKGQPKFKKRSPNQDVPNFPEANYDRGGGSQIDKPTCSNCGNQHFGKCLAATNGCFVCGKDDHKVRDFLLLQLEGERPRKLLVKVRLLFI